MFWSITSRPATAQTICEVVQSLSPGMVLVIEEVVSMMTARLYGMSEPPFMAAVDVADRFIEGMPMKPPNHRLTLAVCVTAIALYPVVLPGGVWHSTKNGEADMVDEQNMVCDEIASLLRKLLAFNCPDTELYCLIAAVTAALYAPLDEVVRSASDMACAPAKVAMLVDETSWR